MTTYTISNLAREFGLTLRAIRFYESRGLIAPSRNGSHRVYTAEDRERLRQITAWTRFGFTLSEIKGALGSGGFSKEQLQEQITHLARQRDEMRDAISDLEDQVAA